MQYSICLPYMKRDITRQTLLDWCKVIEQGPFTSLSCGERITGYTLEMRNVLAFAAAVTERVRIVPSLYVLPMHSAVWAAKEIATLDLLSSGRVTVTVGVGGRENDYRAVGASFEHRHERQDEQIAIMKSIWAGQPPFPGADEVGPRPVQTDIPILAGVMGPKATARAAHWADGVYSFSMGGSGSETQKMFNQATQSWQAAGRSSKPRLVGGFWCCLADSPKDKLQHYVYDYLKTLGDDMANAIASSMTRYTEPAIMDALDAIEATGCDEVYLVPATAETSEVDRLCNLLAKR